MKILQEIVNIIMEIFGIFFWNGIYFEHKCEEDFAGEYCSNSPYHLLIKTYYKKTWHLYSIISGHFETISGHFFANYKTKVRTVLLRFLTGVNVNVF